MHKFSTYLTATSKSRRQKDDTKQVPYRGPTNIRHHGTECSHHGELVPEVCAPLIRIILYYPATCFGLSGQSQGNHFAYNTNRRYPCWHVSGSTDEISPIKQRYKILQKTEKSRQIVNRPTMKHVRFLRKHKKAFFMWTEDFDRRGVSYPTV